MSEFTNAVERELSGMTHESSAIFMGWEISHPGIFTSWYKYQLVKIPGFVQETAATSIRRKSCQIHPYKYQVFKY